MGLLERSRHEGEPSEFVGFEVLILGRFRALRVVPDIAGVGEIVDLPAMVEIGGRPGTPQDLHGLLKNSTVALFVPRVGRLVEVECFAPVQPAAEPHLHAPATHMVEHRDILGKTHGMPEGNDIGRLTDADALRMGGNVGTHQHRVWTDLEALKAEMMLGEPDRIPARLVANGGDFAGFIDDLMKLLLEAEVCLVREISKLHCAPPRNRRADRQANRRMTYHIIVISHETPPTAGTPEAALLGSN